MALLVKSNTGSPTLLLGKRNVCETADSTGMRLHCGSDKPTVRSLVLLKSPTPEPQRETVAFTHGVGLIARLGSSDEC